jgi:hypothetical protein
VKRDLDLIRELLLFLERKPTPSIIEDTDISIAGYESLAIQYHLLIMAQADLIDCEKMRSSSTPERIIRVMPFGLTWKGHEYLDAVRDKTVWNKVKAIAGEKSADLVFGAAVAIGKAAIKEAANRAGLNIETLLT